MRHILHVHHRLIVRISVDLWLGQGLRSAKIVEIAAIMRLLDVAHEHLFVTSRRCRLRSERLAPFGQLGIVDQHVETPRRHIDPDHIAGAYQCQIAADGRFG